MRPATAPESHTDTRYAGWCRRLAASDATALDELFGALHDHLLAFAASLVDDPAVARDVVQEAFIRIWSRRATLDASRSLRALLFQSVRNLASNHRRDEATRSRLLAVDGTVPVPAPSRPDEALDASTLEADIRRFVAELPARQREALELSRFHGLTHDEIAAVMGVSPNTVNNHLVKAIVALRARLVAAGHAA